MSSKQNILRSVAADAQLARHDVDRPARAGRVRGLGVGARRARRAPPRAFLRGVRRRRFAQPSREINFRATRRVGPSFASPARPRPTRAVLADAASGTFDDLEFDQEKYSWRVGGPNDIPCVHLRDVYRGEKPLEPRPSPFCTKSSCPVSIGDRTPLSLNRTFVSEDDRVLLKSMAFGCVSSSARRRERPPPHARARPPIPPLPFRPDLRKRFHEKRRKAARSGRQEDCSSLPEKIRARRDTTR